MHGLRLKIIILTFLPLMLVMATIAAVAIYNKSQAERDALLVQLNTYRSLLESGDVSFDTAQDKNRLRQIIGEEVQLAEILRSDYSVIYSSENSPAPLITDAERAYVDSAARGIETSTSDSVDGRPAFTIITPLAVGDQVAAVLHVRLSDVESASRVMQYAAFMIALILGGLLICFALVYALLDRAVVENIAKLREATEGIQTGQLDRRIEIATSDEIGELAESFNAMTDNLRKSRRSIEKQVKEISAERSKLLSLVESVRLGVVMVDLNLSVVLSNTAARTVFGKGPAHQLTFADVSEKVKGKVNISQALSSYVKTGKPLNIQEVTIGDAYYRLFMSPVRDLEEKMFIGAVFIMEDISEEKKLNQTRSEIISITSHQLRTPATIVKGNLDMLIAEDFGKISKKQHELLEETYMGNERMIHLVNDLMDASKIDEGRFVLQAEPQDLEDMVAEVVKEVMPFADKKKVKLTFKKSGPYPKAKINRQRVKQVIQNLTDNAIKYSSAGDKGHVETMVKQDGKFLDFSVTDNGIGIPAADRPHIFERFYRGSNSSRMDPGGGTGLGLYIAKGVVEQGGGKLWFESKEGGGTTFHATFPIA